MITEQGVIDKISGRKATVRIQKSSACSSCESRDSCDVHGGKPMAVEHPNCRCTIVPVEDSPTIEGTLQVGDGDFTLNGPSKGTFTVTNYNGYDDGIEETEKGLDRFQWYYLAVVLAIIGFAFITEWFL